MRRSLCPVHHHQQPPCLRAAFLPACLLQDAASLRGSVPEGGGVYVQGLFMEGAAWDANAGLMQESEPKVRPRTCYGKCALPPFAVCAVPLHARVWGGWVGTLLPYGGFN